MDFKKVSYRSSVGDMDIPAYLFQPLKKRGPKGHAAMVWVHGGVHGNWGVGMFPFVREAVERGYIVICPEYRGSTGYGEAHHNAIDYGGYEIDDTMSAVDYLRTLPHVDQDRLGIMGWSHGGYITLLSVFREKHPFKAAAAMVPVTNLVFRPCRTSYQRQFSTQSRIRGLPFEKRSLYIERSPLYHVDKLQYRSSSSPPTTPTSILSKISRSSTRCGRASPISPRPRSTSTPFPDRQVAATRSTAASTRRHSSATIHPISAIRGTGHGPSSSGSCDHAKTAACKSSTSWPLVDAAAKAFHRVGRREQRPWLCVLGALRGEGFGRQTPLG